MNVPGDHSGIDLRRPNVHLPGRGVAYVESAIFDGTRTRITYCMVIPREMQMHSRLAGIEAAKKNAIRNLFVRKES